MKKEWDRLRVQNVRDESGARERSHVAREVADVGSKAHAGMLFGVCVGKNSELKAGDPRRKFKGPRVHRRTGRRRRAAQ